MEDLYVKKCVPADCYLQQCVRLVTLTLSIFTCTPLLSAVNFNSIICEKDSMETAINVIIRVIVFIEINFYEISHARSDMWHAAKTLNKQN